MARTKKGKISNQMIGAAWGWTRENVRLRKAKLEEECPFCLKVFESMPAVQKALEKAGMTEEEFFQHIGIEKEVLDGAETMLQIIQRMGGNEKMFQAAKLAMAYATALEKAKKDKSICALLKSLGIDQ